MDFPGGSRSPLQVVQRWLPKGGVPGRGTGGCSPWPLRAGLSLWGPWNSILSEIRLEQVFLLKGSFDLEGLRLLVSCVGKIIGNLPLCLAPPKCIKRTSPSPPKNSFFLSSPKETWHLVGSVFRSEPKWKIGILFLFEGVCWWFWYFIYLLFSFLELTKDIMLYYIILDYVMLCYIMFYYIYIILYIVLYYILLYLYHFILYYIIFYYIILYHIILYYMSIPWKIGCAGATTKKTLLPGESSAGEILHGVWWPTWNQSTRNLDALYRMVPPFVDVCWFINKTINTIDTIDISPSSVCRFINPTSSLYHVISPQLCLLVYKNPVNTIDTIDISPINIYKP